MKQPPEITRRAASAAYAIACVATLVLVARLCLIPVRSDDVFFYLAMGRRLFAEGGLPSVDPYLFTLPGQRWEILHEWGTFAICHLLYASAGWVGLIVGKTLVIVAGHCLPLVLSRLYRFRSLLVPIIVAVAAFAAAPRFIERSSVFSDVLTSAVVFLVLVRMHFEDQGRSTRWASPVTIALFALWANLHPGFLGGLMILALQVASRTLSLALRRELRSSRARVGRDVGLLLLAALACLATPQGVHGFVYPLKPLFDEAWDAYRAHNLEWRSTLHPANLGLASVRTFFVLPATCAASIALAFLRRRGGSDHQRLIFGVLATVWLTWLSCSAIRFVNTGALALAVLATMLIRTAGLFELRKGASGRGGLLLSFVFAAMVAWLVGGSTTPGDQLPLARGVGELGLDAAIVPVRAAQVVERLDPNAHVFNQHEFGSYLIWRWGGRRKIFYHGFVTDLAFYRDDYVAINRSREDFERIVRKYDVDVFFLAAYPASPTSGPLLYRILLSSPEWRLIHADEAAMVFVRSRTRVTGSSPRIP
jgi:hypothetical protein